MSEPPAGPSTPNDPGRDPRYGPHDHPQPYGQPEPYGQPQPYGQYGQQPYEQYGQFAGYPQGPPVPRPTPTLTGLLGARARRRPEARFSSALAAAGTALAVIGAYVWSVGYFVAGFGFDFPSGDGDGTPTAHGEGRRFLGAGLFLVLTLLGYAAVVLRRRGPLATAGVVATILALPAALAFLFLDLSGSFTSGDPINIDALYLISILVWLASYLAVPGARGRAAYLAVAAGALPTYIGFKASGSAAFQAGFSAASGGLGGGSGPDTHTGTVATIALVFGLGYYLIAALLDRAGRAGIAVGLLAPAFVVTAGGIALAANDFGRVGTGATLLVVGVLVSAYAGRFGRRFTTWAWAAGAAAGIVLMVSELGVDRYTTIGIVLLVVGLVLAVGSGFVSSALREEPDLVEEPAAGR